MPDPLADELRKIISSRIAVILRSEALVEALNGKVDIPEIGEVMEAIVIRKVLNAAADRLESL